MQLSDIPDSVIQQAKSYSENYLHEESCGIIYRDGTLKFKPCENISHNRQAFFEINPHYLIEYNVVCIYHSHVKSSSKPSSNDIAQSESLGLPYLIYSLRDKNFSLYSV